LEALLAPISIETFLAEYWGKKPLHIKGSAQKVRQIFGDRFCDAPLDSLLERALQYPGRAQCQAYPNTGRWADMVTSDGRTPRLIIDPAQASTFVESGTLVSLVGVEQLDSTVARICDTLKYELGFIGHFMSLAFWSKRASGLKTHFDRNPLLQVQMCGAKNWSIGSEAVVAWPETNAVTNNDGTAEVPDGAWGRRTIEVDESSLTDIQMCAGDVLYMPGGVWHRTRASDELSMTIDFTAVQKNFRYFLETMFDDVFSDHEAWRSALPVFDANRADGQLPPVVRDFIGQRIDELRAYLDRVDPRGDQVQILWCQTYANHDRPRREVRKPWPLQPAKALAPDDELKVARSLAMAKDESASGTVLRVFGGNHELYFDEEEYIEFGRRLADQLTPFRAADACTWTKGARAAWSDIAEKLETLLEMGLLVRMRVEAGDQVFGPATDPLMPDLRDDRPSIDAAMRSEPGA
jgi:ribosomal protein L16 Arg81 hydroxylase